MEIFEILAEISKKITKIGEAEISADRQKGFPPEKHQKLP